MGLPQVNTDPPPDPQAPHPSPGGRQPTRCTAQCGQLATRRMPRPALATRRRPAPEYWTLGLVWVACAGTPAGTALAAAPSTPALVMATPAGQAGAQPAGHAAPPGQGVLPAPVDPGAGLARPALARFDEGERPPPAASADSAPPSAPDNPSTGALIGAALLALVWLQRRSRTA